MSVLVLDDSTQKKKNKLSPILRSWWCSQDVNDEDESEEIYDEIIDRDDATLDQAPSIHSLDGDVPSWADVSLQTGQSLLVDEPAMLEQKPAQLTKQTSTTQIPAVSMSCQSLMTEPVQSTSLAKSSQESIKVSKRTDGTHDVIEIATKNIPTIEQPRPTNLDDIVVDMKYQDAQVQKSATSELSIQHAAPQSFETVLVEPDDVTTEVVVDADGTKRIIVRQLRRTLVTSTQTSQQHVSTLATSMNDAPLSVQAFSEATVRGQQVTVTRTRPDGSIETSTKQTYGGRVTTGAPGDRINVEEFEAAPQYTHSVVQGEIGDLDTEITVPEYVTDEAGYSTQTSSVHATVQQVTRRVIKKTRRIIRKVTIIDGKETTTEEVIEEPEEVEIDEQDIPHISINVVKREDERGLQTTEICSVDTTGHAAPISPLQGPFFGPFAHESIPQGRQRKIETNVIQKLEEPSASSSSVPTPSDSMQQSKTPAIETLTEFTTKRLSETSKQAPEFEKLHGKGSRPQSADKHEREYFPVEVIERTMQQKLVGVSSQNLIDSESCAVLQTPVQEVSAATAIQAESSLESTIELDDAHVEDTRATCKSVVAPSVKSETIEVERGTVDVDKHPENSSTVEVNDDKDVVLLEGDKVNETDVSTVREASSSPTKPKDSTDESSKSIPSDERPDNDDFLNGERRDATAALTADSRKPEHKSVMEKVEISLSVEKRDGVAGSSVSMVTQAEHPEVTPGHHIVKEDVDIRLPAEKEIVEIINTKILQTSALSTAEKDTEMSATYELKPQTVEETSICVDKSETESTSDSKRSRKKKKRRERTPPDNKTLFDDDGEISGTSIATTIAESTDINIPLSDSPKLSSEQPQPDMLEITDDSSLAMSIRRDDSLNEESGYEPDERPSTLDEGDKPEDFDGMATQRRQKKKKKQQRVKVPREEEGEATALPRSSTSQDAEISTDQEVTAPLVDPQPTTQSAKKGKKGKQSKKNDEIDEKPLRTEADTQTVFETRDISTGKVTPDVSQTVDSSLQTSPDEFHETQEREIQTATMQDTHTTIQTSPTPIADSGIQTVTVKSPEREHSSMQTESPVQTATEEGAVQTSPLETPAVKSPVEVVEIDVQTNVVAMDSTQAQTSPIEPTATAEIETQTVKESESSLDVEAQTTPPPPLSISDEVKLQESSMPTLIETAETDVQTSKSPSPEVPQMEHFEVQTDIKEQVSLGTSETQTTPPPPLEEINIAESSIQTDLPEVTETSEINVQTSKPTSPVPPATEHFEMQANLILEIPQGSAETQTTPRQVETQEIQTKSPEPTTETVMQTSPMTSPERVKIAELSAQTSVEEPIPTVEEESQTAPDKLETQDSMIQIKIEELVPTSEEGAQIIPDTAEISLQTTASEDRPLVSASQQTLIESVEASTMPDPPLEIIEIEELPVEIETQNVEQQQIEQHVEQRRVEQQVEQQNEEQPVEQQRVQQQLETVPEVKKSARIISEIQSIPLRQELPVSGDDSTPDTSFEIHVRATVEFSDNSLLTGSESTTEPTSSLTFTEDSLKLHGADDTADPGRSSKRQKRKRKHKNIEDRESTILKKDQHDNVDPTLRQTGQSNDAFLRPSYSEVAQKLGSRKEILGYQGSDLQSGDEEPVDNVTIGRVFTDLKLSSIKQHDKSPEGLDEGSRTDEDLGRQTEIIVGASIRVDDSRDIDNANAPEYVAMKGSSAAAVVFPEALRIETSPEPMDTSEEPLSPMESVPSERKKHEIKSYAEAIAESEPSSKLPTASSKISDWEKHTVLTLQNVPAKKSPSSSASTSLILAEAREYSVTPRNQLLQRTHSTRMVSERLNNLPKAKETNRLSNILHVATLDDVREAKPVEVRASQIQQEFAQLRNAVHEENIVVVEESLITIVETISTWLETIEYRIFLGRDSPSGPNYDDTRTFINLRDEVNYVESSVKELDQIWTELEGKYPEEERGRIRECVEALEHQVKAIENVTRDGERYTNAELARWDEFINGVNNVYR